MSKHVEKIACMSPSVVKCVLQTTSTPFVPLLGLWVSSDGSWSLLCVMQTTAPACYYSKGKEQGCLCDSWSLLCVKAEAQQKQMVGQ